MLFLNYLYATSFNDLSYKIHNLPNLLDINLKYLLLFLTNKQGYCYQKILKIYMIIIIL